MPIELDNAKIEQAVIDEVADRLCDDDDLRVSVDKAVSERINRHFVEIADAQIAAAVEAAVREGFDREYHKTDSFGLRQGEPTTVRRELNKLISSYWQQRVDRNGKPTDSTYHTTTRAEWMMVQVCGGDFSKQIRQEVVNTTANLKDGLRNELKVWVDKTLGDLFRVQSNGDKAGS